ncbi:MAG TPA: hypothetical protein P5229_03610 [Candidatus Gracilibacteria bacterium]|nr:hypothetical protein [Candidatus Gracilibacteria bacterium]HRY91397.1 hypothetical protein [Candidatus Gracilibacteria bacterium]
MKKTFIILTLTGYGCFLLAGCNSELQPNSTNNVSSAVTQQTETTQEPSTQLQVATLTIQPKTTPVTKPAAVLEKEAVTQSPDATPATEETQGVAATQENTPDNSVEAFAKCLTAKGAIMYGAYWCPHCQKQKAEFGDSFKYINYVECGEGQENSNIVKCAADKIQGYPTWYFTKGGYQIGEKSFAELATISGCVAPN